MTNRRLRHNRLPRPPEALWLRKDHPSTRDYYEYVEHSRRCLCLRCEPGPDNTWDQPHYFIFIPASKREQSII